MLKRAAFSVFVSMLSVCIFSQEEAPEEGKPARKQKRAEKVEQGKFMAFPFAHLPTPPNLALLLWEP